MTGEEGVGSNVELIVSVDDSVGTVDVIRVTGGCCVTIGRRRANVTCDVTGLLLLLLLLLRLLLLLLLLTTCCGFMLRFTTGDRDDTGAGGSGGGN